MPPTTPSRAPAITGSKRSGSERARAEKRGIATVTWRPAGSAGEPKAARRQGVAAFRSQFLGVTAQYRFYGNIIPDARQGLVLRQLPIDPAADLPITLRPGETVD